MHFFSLKASKNPDADEINFNVKVFKKFCGPLKYLFDLSLQSGVFPDLMKVAIVLRYLKLVILRVLAIIAQFLFFLVSQKYLNA